LTGWSTRGETEERLVGEVENAARLGDHQVALRLGDMPPNSACSTEVAGGDLEGALERSVVLPPLLVRLNPAGRSIVTEARRAQCRSNLLCWQRDKHRVRRRLTCLLCLGVRSGAAKGVEGCSETDRVGVEVVDSNSCSDARCCFGIDSGPAARSGAARRRRASRGPGGRGLDLEEIRNRPDRQRLRPGRDKAKGGERSTMASKPSGRRSKESRGGQREGRLHHLRGPASRRWPRRPSRRRTKAAQAGRRHHSQP